jgi:hypothetical protein
MCLIKTMPHGLPSPLFNIIMDGVKLRSWPPPSRPLRLPSRPIKGIFSTTMHHLNSCCPLFHSSGVQVTKHRAPTPTTAAVHRHLAISVGAPLTHTHGEHRHHPLLILVQPRWGLVPRSSAQCALQQATICLMPLVHGIPIHHHPVVVHRTRAPGPPGFSF